MGDRPQFDSPRDIPEQPRTRQRLGVSDTVSTYTGKKTSEPHLQQEMMLRAVEVAREGAKQVRKNINRMFSGENPAHANGALSELLRNEQMSVLDGQPEKVARMEQFVADMTSWGDQLIAEFAASEDMRAYSAGEREESLAKYAANVRELVVEATRAITYQDTRASAVTLGDHGWMHLTQDLRDAQIIVANKRGKELSPKEKFMLGLAAAFHDMGYAVPQVSDAQMASGGMYGSFDKGHPINSYVYLVGEKEKYRSILGKESADALFQIVANHESPDLAERAGAHADLAEGFALADASAAFGIDKLPPVVVQIPEVLTYLSVLSANDRQNFGLIFDQLEPRGRYAEAANRVKELEALLKGYKSADGSITSDAYQQEQLLDQLHDSLLRLRWTSANARDSSREGHEANVVDLMRDRAIQAIDERVTHKAPKAGQRTEPQDERLLSQAEAMKNAVKHFSDLSLKFLLGRMCAESLPVQVNDEGKVEFTIHAGFARQLEAQGIIRNTVNASAVLTVKLFLEQSAIVIQDKSLEKSIVDTVMRNEQPTQEVQAQLSQLGIAITVESGEARAVHLQSKTVVVVSKTDAPITPENKPFYDRILDQLNEANEQTGAFIRKHNASQNEKVVQ